MHGKMHVLIASFALLATLHWAPPAAAEEEELHGPPLPAAAAPAPNPLGGKAVNGQVLGAQRGGAEVVNDMTLKGLVGDNEAKNVMTGGNIITQGALTGAAGVPMVIQNTGNNVLIQNATIVNLQVR